MEISNDDIMQLETTRFCVAIVTRCVPRDDQHYNEITSLFEKSLRLFMEKMEGFDTPPFLTNVEPAQPHECDVTISANKKTGQIQAELLYTLRFYNDAESKPEFKKPVFKKTIQPFLVPGEEFEGVKIEKKNVKVI